MKIIKLLYLKYGLSFSICLISSVVIFFIFSLLGNLNEDYKFSDILKLSLLNSFQIIMYVPSFIFLISVILFTNFLRSKNEITIIKSYLSIQKLMLFFLPVVLIFSILEMNKREFSSFLENSKANLVKKNKTSISKIIINEDEDFKTFTVLENIDLENLENAEYRSYKIFDEEIKLVFFSNNLIISNNALIAKNFTKYNNNLIEDYNIEKDLNINVFELLDKNSIVTNLSKNNDLNIDINSINFLIFFILYFIYVFLIFFNKKYIYAKQNLLYPIFVSLIFTVYSFLVFNNSLSFYKQEFEIIASIIIFILVFKESVSE